MGQVAIECAERLLKCSLGNKKSTLFDMRSSLAGLVLMFENDEC
jgi:hypothetical protein